MAPDDLKELLALGTDVLMVARHAEDAVGGLEAGKRREVRVALKNGSLPVERTVGEVARDEDEVGLRLIDDLHHGFGAGGGKEVRGVQVRDLGDLEALELGRKVPDGHGHRLDRRLGERVPGRGDAEEDAEDGHEARRDDREKIALLDGQPHLPAHESAHAADHVARERQQEEPVGKAHEEPRDGQRVDDEGALEEVRHVEKGEVRGARKRKEGRDGKLRGRAEMGDADRAPDAVGGHQCRDERADEIDGDVHGNGIGLVVWWFGRLLRKA